MEATKNLKRKNRCSATAERWTPGRINGHRGLTTCQRREGRWLVELVTSDRDGCQRGLLEAAAGVGV